MRRAAVHLGRSTVEDLTGDARDEITFIHDGAIYIVTQDSPYPTGQRIYTPTRALDISHPGWTVNEH